MRSYLSYRADGTFCGVIRPHPFPASYDILSNNPKHQLAAEHYAIHSALPGFEGILPFDCDCEDEETCQCAALATYSHYVENGELKEKAPLILKIDGQAVTSSATSPLPRTPGVPFVLEVHADVPDGTRAPLKMLEAQMSLTQPVLVFHNGVASCSLVAPAQGIRSVLTTFEANTYLRPVVLFVVGWAS